MKKCNFPHHDEKDDEKNKDNPVTYEQLLDKMFDQIEVLKGCIQDGHYMTNQGWSLKWVHDKYLYFMHLVCSKCGYRCRRDATRKEKKAIEFLNLHSSAFKQTPEERKAEDYE